LVTVKIKQKPVTMGDRTTHRTLSPDIAYLRVRHLGHYFMEPGDYQDAPVSKTLHFIRSVGLLEG
jgi:hypothetical protein